MSVDLINIERIPYRNLKKVIDLVTIDRPILSLFTNDKKEYFFLYLYDSNETIDEYIFWRINLVDLYAFLYKRVSLREVILAKTKDFVFILKSDYESIEDLENLSLYKVYQIQLEGIDLEWLPREDSFWTFPIPNPLVRVLEKFAQENYVEALRENSVYFLVEPSDK